MKIRVLEDINLAVISLGMYCARERIFSKLKSKRQFMSNQQKQRMRKKNIVSRYRRIHDEKAQQS